MARERNIVADKCEFHFLLECESYKELRDEYFGNIISRQKTTFNFVKIMKSENENVIISICKYVYFAFQLRNKLLEQ